MNIADLPFLAIARLRRRRVKANWWHGRVNFGDLITPELFRRNGYSPHLYGRKEADIIGCGSILQAVDPGFAGTILGTGMIEDSPHKLPHATFASVRGDLSRRCLGLDDTTMTGDLGLLAPALLQRHRKSRYQVGIVPHFVDKANPWLISATRTLGERGTIIDVEQAASNVISEIAECELILSSSLHGIIVADALGIPNVWIELSDLVLGAGFKFRDYNTSVNYEQAALSVHEGTSIASLEAAASDKDFSYITGKQQQLAATVSSVLERLSF